MECTKTAGRVRGAAVQKGRSGNPAGRRIGCRNQKTIAAAALPKGPSSFYNP